MSEQNQRGEELFDKLSKEKKKRRSRVVRTVLITLAVVAVILVVTVRNLRRNVEERFAAERAEVLSYEVKTGTLHTVVSGTGVLAEVDQEQLTVPAGVEVDEVAVEAGDLVSRGDLLATVDMATVMTALSDLQEQMDDLDDEINDAKGEQVGSTITAGISGRVKKIYAQQGMDVAACMADHGALALLSLDGHMAVDILTDALAKGDEVEVLRADGTKLTGTVESAAGGKATVLVTDNGPKHEEEVTVLSREGTALDKGSLYIHNPVAVIGYAGTIRSVSAKENARVSSSSGLFSLKDTSFSANYDSLLRDRAELEETLLELLTIYRDGAVMAPMDGMVSSVEFEEEETAEASAYSAYATTVSEASEGTELLTLYPNVSMSITISIDETDILALKEGQEAEVEVSSVSEELFAGTVTEISKVADTSTGVTQYSAEVTLERAEGMLPGMTAEVDVKIQGVENVLIIPVDALHQTSAISYVYTTYDEELQQYGGMVEVTTGMQNENYVEILSGLKEGDTIYYTERQEIFSFFNMMGGGMGGNMGGMGNMGGGRGSMGGMPGGNAMPARPQGG
nr:HlyD family efflux transporter periplasmic adaptor subunit [Oscillospiraceae bacterium]